MTVDYKHVLLNYTLDHAKYTIPRPVHPVLYTIMQVTINSSYQEWQYMHVE